MTDKKERSSAQRAADKRYREKYPNKERNIQFKLPRAEADDIIAYIAGTGLSKADFLRLSIKAHQEGKIS